MKITCDLSLEDLGKIARTDYDAATADLISALGDFVKFLSTNPGLFENVIVSKNGINMITSMRGKETENAFAAIESAHKKHKVARDLLFAVENLAIRVKTITQDGN